MKYLRTTYWSRELKPTTAVVGQDSLTVPVEEVSFTASPDAFIVDEIFEYEGSQGNAVMDAVARASATAQSEANQAIMFFWLHQRFPLVKTYGVLATEKPAPFDVAGVERVFRQLADLSDYRDFMFSATAEDGTVVTRNRVGVFTHERP